MVQQKSSGVVKLAPYSATPRDAEIRRIRSQLLSFIFSPPLLYISAAIQLFIPMPLPKLHHEQERALPLPDTANGNGYDRRPRFGDAGSCGFGTSA